MTIVRGVLAATALGAAVVGLAQCSSSESASAFEGDGGSSDAGSDASDAPFPDSGAPQVLLAVHASPDLFDVRVCFGASSSMDGVGVHFADVAPWPSDDSHPMPASNYAGIAVGGGAGVPREIVAQGEYVIPYLIDAHTLAMSRDPTSSCASRICQQGTGVCLNTSDYVQLPAIPSSSLGSGTKLLAIVGCKTPGSAACGTTMGGQLHAEVLPLTIDQRLSPDNIGVQLAHVAFALGSITATFDNELTNIGVIPLDPLNAGPQFGAIVNRPTMPNASDWGTQGVTIHARVDGGATLRMSLADIQRVSNASLLPSDLFTRAGSYVFVLVGDPNAASPLYVDGGINPKFDGVAPHIVAISTAPASLGDGG